MTSNTGNPGPRPPVRGGRRALTQGKGRQPEAAAVAEVRRLLADRPRRRDLLIEHLHTIQDASGCLRARHLVALAQEMRLPLAEVWEVATFYHNFRVVADEAPAPAPLVQVCDSLSCALAGAGRLRREIADGLDGAATVTGAACMGRCDGAPVVRLGHDYIVAADAGTVLRTVAGAPPPAEPLPPAAGLAAYRAAGGYRLLADCRDGRRTPEAVIATLEAAGLRGLGGAGFPVARKWRLVRDQPGPRLMAVNGDESEPGTFKDRHYLLSDPHRFLEGLLIGAWAVEAAAVYVYLRDEYPHARARLAAALDEANAAGLPLPPIELRRGAGAYICGEESAMLESLEGKRGLPRHKPPFPSQVGLFGRPTLINNVESLFWVRDLVEQGPERFAAAGRRGHRGWRSFSVSGRVRTPGVKLAPAGISVRELIDEHCGGMAPGHRFHAYLPGGASGGILPASLGDLPLDFGSLEPHGALIGSAAIIVLSDRDDLRAAALNLMHFFADESCGQCTPCRLGTVKAAALMQQPDWDAALLSDLAGVMAAASICGLGQAAPNGLLSLLRHFPEELTS